MTISSNDFRAAAIADDMRADAFIVAYDIRKRYYDKMISTLLELEGGYGYNPNDKGGETKYGITKKSYPHLDIKNLTKEDAVEIYKRDWLVRYSGLYDSIYAHIDACGSEFKQDITIRFSPTFFYFAVNAGTQRAVRLLQKAINETSKNIRKQLFISEDGLWGAQSSAALQTVIYQNGNDTPTNEISRALNIVARFKEDALRHYYTLALKPTQRQFLCSWVGRLLRD